MAGSKGVLFGRMKVPDHIENDFNDWYNNEYTPPRLGFPGILAVRRFKTVDKVAEGEPNYATLYDLADASVVKTEPYLGLRASQRAQISEKGKRVRAAFEANFVRSICEQLYPGSPVEPAVHGKALMAVMIDIAPEKEAEFSDWCRSEHIPALSSVPGILTARHFRTVEGWPKFINLYDLEDEKVLQSEAFEKARQSAWGDRLRPFYQRRLRFLGRRIYPPISAKG